MRPPAWLAGCLIGAVVAGLVAAATAAVRDAFGGLPPFILFVLPVLMAAVWGGWKAGLVTTALSAVLAISLFIEPTNGLLPSVGDRARIIVFTVVGVAVSLLANKYLVIRRLSDRQRELLAAAETYRGIVEEGAAIICRYRPNGVLTFVNEAYCQCFGRSREELVGHTFAPLVPDEDRPAIVKLLQELRPDMEPYTVEHRVVVADGSTRWQRWTNRPIKDAAGRFVEYQAVGLDITERREAEERYRSLNDSLERLVAERTAELRESERRFRAIFHSQFQFIGLMTTDGTLLEANESALHAGGMAPEDALGRPLWEAPWWPADPESKAMLRDEIRRAAEGELIRHEQTIRGAGGQPLEIDFTIKPFRDDAGRVVLLIPEGHDITDRKRVEAALRASEERFRAFMDHLPLAAWATDAGGRLVVHNRFLANMIRREPGEITGQTRFALLDPDTARAHETNDRRVRETGTALELEEEYIRPDGTPGVTYSVKFPVRGSDGALLVGGVALDVTERVRAEERVVASLREKEVMLKDIHHRVKNNLQVVSTLLDLQSGYTTDPAVLAMFKESRGRVRSMAFIHERLYRSADLARVEFAEYIRQLAADLYRAYKVCDDDIRLAVEVDAPPLPIDLAIPCGLLLNELVSNCLKHAFRATGQGTILVALSRSGASGLERSVADDGAGFPPGTDFRESPSFGLQLVTTLVEQLNGEFSLTNGKGSTFTVRFPILDR